MNATTEARRWVKPLRHRNAWLALWLCAVAVLVIVCLLPSPDLPKLRVGAGRGGNVVAGQISQLAARPLGVNAVTNPLPATGGVDGDGPAEVRASAPLGMLALDSR